MDSEAPLYIMYTSGSTGKPKGLVHTTAGFCVNMKMSMLHAWDINQDDILGCPADIGWQVGHSMNIYGSLLNGNTAFLFESTPVFPNPGRFFRSMEKWGFTHFMSAPTAYRRGLSGLTDGPDSDTTHRRVLQRMLMKDDLIDQYDLSKLRDSFKPQFIIEMVSW